MATMMGNALLVVFNMAITLMYTKFVTAAEIKSRTHKISGTTYLRKDPTRR
jgi:hypothetical protein